MERIARAAPASMRIARGLLAAALAVAPVSANADLAPPTRVVVVPADAAFRFTLYFSTPQAEADDRRAVIAEAGSVAATSVTAATTAPQLLALLRRHDAVLRRVFRHSAYLALRAAEDAGDASRSAAADDLDEQISSQEVALRRKLATLDERRVNLLAAAEPRLRAYAYFLHTERDEVAHAAAPRREPSPSNAAAPSASPDADLSLGERYRRLAASAAYPKVATSTGEVDPRDERATANANRAVRRAAAEARAAGRAAIEAQAAGLLFAVVRQEDASAKRRNFADAITARYGRLALTQSQVGAVLDATARQAPANQEYQRLLARIAARQLGIERVRSYDLGQPPAGFTPPSFSLAEARTILPAALQPLGPTYVAEYSALLDPRNGRLDLTGGTDRDETGFSVGFPGAVSAVYLSPYRGTLNNLRQLIHEGGHATHRQLMNEHGVLPVYATGPNYLFEAIAIFNELLLYDSLQRNATAKEWKAYYLQRFLDDITFQVFGSAEETSLEEQIHRGVMAGTLHDAAGLDALTLRVLGTYDTWSAGEADQQRFFWVGRSLFWRDPLYSVNYLYAGLLAAEFYRAKERDPAGFQKRYITLLENGFTAPPDVLLERFLRIDLGPAMVDDAATLIRMKTAALAAAQTP